MLLTWFGHSMFRLESDGKLYFFDPIRTNKLLDSYLPEENSNEAISIFITLEHWEHCDPPAIFILSNANTEIVCPETILNRLINELTYYVDCAEDIKNYLTRVRVVSADDEFDENILQIKVLKAKEGIAFYIKEKDRTLLIMGASTLTEEMIALKPNWVIFPTWSIATQENKLAFESLPSTTCCIPCLYHTNPEALANFYLNSKEYQDLHFNNLETVFAEIGTPIEL